MAEWSLKQHPSVVDSFLSVCDKAMETSVIARLDLLSKYGNMLQAPFTKKVGAGLYELRARSGSRLARLIFFYDPKIQKRIIFVHALFKTTKKLPKQDLRLAIKRKIMIESGKEATNAVGYIN